MSYAAPADLAVALGMDRLTPEAEPLLQDCLDAAAAEIDRIIADSDPLVLELPAAQALLKRTNVNRAVEWFKAPAAYNGGVGTAETGALTKPNSGFERHAAVLYALTLTGASGVA